MHGITNADVQTMSFVNDNRFGYAAPMMRLRDMHPLSTTLYARRSAARNFIFPATKRYLSASCLAMFCALLLFTACAAPTETNAAQADTASAEKTGAKPDAINNAKPTPIMPIDDVRIGMKGYGLTVFHGVKIEPFEVEVISVQHEFAPKRGVIWIRCLDERLQKTGPVQGMSGSPIYLWDQNTDKSAKQTPGQGGKLIGAFAFGFSWTKDCYAGVQPIELMRATGQNINEEKSRASLKLTSRTPTGASIVNLMQLAPKLKWNKSDLWEAKLHAKLLGLNTELKSLAINNNLPTQGPNQLSGKPTRLMLPVTVSSGHVAKALSTFLEPMGMTALQSPAGISTGRPPHGIDPDKIKLAPGSVLSIPLATGDVDMSATGTVTDVLPDGKVLGFGHPMFGTGDVLVPMGTGYVHYIVPRYSTAFKLSGGAQVKGAIMRDDAAAVAGVPNATFGTAKIKVTVDFDGKIKTYNYRVAHHQRLTPTLAATVVSQSVTADQNLPTQCSISYAGEAVFQGGRTVELNATLAPVADPTQMMAPLLPPIASMVQNKHEPMMLETLSINVKVKSKIEAALIVGIRVENTEIKPGESVIMNLALRAYDGSTSFKKLSFKTPDNLAPGQYSLIVGDASTYANILVASKPHLMKTKTKDDVFNTVKTIASIRRDTLFMAMRLPQSSGIAIGRRELPRLPSSKKALIATSQNTLASSFFEIIHQQVKLGKAVQGTVTFKFNVEQGSTKENN